MFRRPGGEQQGLGVQEQGGSSDVENNVAANVSDQETLLTREREVTQSQDREHVNDEEVEDQIEAESRGARESEVREPGDSSGGVNMVAEIRQNREGNTSAISVPAHLVTTVDKEFEVFDGNINTVTLSEDTIDRLAEKLSAAMKIKEKKETSKVTECWISTDEVMICRPCQELSSSPEVPSVLRSSKPGNWGIVSNTQEKRKVLYAMMKHESTGLHQWCALQEGKKKDGDAQKEAKETEAGQLVIRNALFCLKKGLSSEDFVSLNSLNHLTPGLNPAVKNNSRKAFFEIRTMIVEETKHFIKKLFCAPVIENIAVTLDKVTVGHVSFTVVCTYFFLYGKPNVILNTMHVRHVNQKLVE